MKLHLPDFIFRNAADAASSGVLITDHQIRDEPIVYANPFFLKLTGYSEREVLGRNCRFLRGPDTDPYITAKIREAIRLEIAFRGEILNYRKDGTPFWNQLTLSPIKDHGGKTIFFIGIQQDVSVQKQAQQDRDSLIQELTTINVGLSEFASTTSHELKNPLGTLLLSSDLLSRKYSDSFDQEGKDLLRQIWVNAKYLSRSLDELVQFSSLGSSPIPFESVNLQNVVDELVQISGIKTAEKFIHASRNLPEITGHRSLMSLVIRNLIDNAVKYGMGKERGIFIEATRLSIGPEKDSPENSVELVVKDHGPGIAREVMGKIFEPFVTTGRSSGTGTGLGLAIVKKVIELHDGTIACHSGSNGTEFVIRIPSKLPKAA
jgi:PAS domain S-box-containing protein